MRMVFNNIPNNNLNVEIQNRIEEIMTRAETALDRYNQFSIDAAEQSYLRNIHNDANTDLLIKYSIRMLFDFGQRDGWSLQNCVDAIICYSFTQNIIFNQNINIVHRELRNELRRILTRDNQINVFVFYNNINNNGVRPMEDVKLTLDQDLIEEKMPVKKYTKEEFGDQDTCVICQDEYTTEDEVRQLDCKHVYHKDCIDKWLTGNSHKCPCCRKSAGEYKARV